MANDPWVEEFFDGFMAGYRMGQKYETRWIPMAKKPPEQVGYYLTSTEFDQVYCDFWNGERFDRTEPVLAWMELPEPWKGVK